jgi:hypothetical protein
MRAQIRAFPLGEFSRRAFDMWSVKMPAASRKRAVSGN